MDPISVSLAEAGCEPDESGVIPLRATYSLAGDSIVLTGASSGTLAGYEVFQSGAENIESVSAGEIGDTVSFVAIASP